jgi:hypothetical protein
MTAPRIALATILRRFALQVGSGLRRLGHAFPARFTRPERETMPISGRIVNSSPDRPLRRTPGDRPRQVPLRDPPAEETSQRPGGAATAHGGDGKQLGSRKHGSDATAGSDAEMRRNCRRRNGRGEGRWINVKLPRKDASVGCRSAIRGNTFEGNAAGKGSGSHGKASAKPARPCANRARPRLRKALGRHGGLQIRQFHISRREVKRCPRNCALRVWG